MFHRVFPLVVLFVGWATVASAISYDFIDPAGQRFLSGYQDVEPEETTVGEVTVHLLEFYKKRNGLKFEATESSVRMINGWPTFTEVLKGFKLKSYGWCFSVNGVVAGTLPNETILQSNSDHLRWFYAYSLFEGGRWTAWCKPTGDDE